MDELFFVFNDTATTEIYTLSLHDALPISRVRHRQQRQGAVVGREDPRQRGRGRDRGRQQRGRRRLVREGALARRLRRRSEEHTSELQSRQYLVCRLLLEKKKLLQTTIACR